MSLAATGTASAQDLDCPDFATQGEAQAVLAADPSDPNRLDANGDGVACESFFGGGSSGTGSTGGTESSDDQGSSPSDSESGTSVSTGSDDGAAPTGGVETGAGGAAGSVAPATDRSGLIAVTLLGAAALGGGVVARRRAAVGENS